MVTELRFQHVVELPHIKTQIATARDNHNKVHIYLIDTDRVYKRNGIRDTWEPVDAGDSRDIRHNVEHSRINHYTS